MPPDGFLNLLKPPGMTSHDCVAWARARLRPARVGHLGTLDPAAAGVLPLAVGRATRLFQYAAGPDKAYRAEIVFGITTDTLDTEGRITSRTDASALDEARLRSLLPQFLGDTEQNTPAFSAAQVDGRRLHRRARAGEPASPRPKRVTISALDLVAFTPGPRARLLLDVVCSPGTYLRAVADDLGRAAGLGAHLGFLVRTRAGRFPLEEARTLGEIQADHDEGHLPRSLLPPDWPLAHLPDLLLDLDSAAKFLRGTQVFADRDPAWPLRIYGPRRTFLGLGEVRDQRCLRPRVVIASEESLHRARRARA